MTRSQLRQVGFIVALGVGVTVGGVAAGALVLAPAVAQATQPATAASVTRVLDQGFGTVRAWTERTGLATRRTWTSLPTPTRRLALPVFFGSLALAGFVATGVSFYRRRPATKTSSASGAMSGMGAMWRSGSRPSARPPRNASRTPKAVQALADSGAEPGEIAWRTGLSLDAVAMLLSIGASPRQLRPPTA